MVVPQATECRNIPLGIFHIGPGCVLPVEGRTLFGVHLQLTHITLSVYTSLLQIHVWNILVLLMRCVGTDLSNGPCS